MNADGAALATHGGSDPSGPDVNVRLAVAWQHPSTRAIMPVGVLCYDGSAYRFWYVRRVLGLDEFRPLLGFPDYNRTYSSDHLFPLFAQRVMDPRRADYSRWVASLDLPTEAAPWEQLARSEGRRVGDMLQLVPEPRVLPGGASTSLFLVHGTRHLGEQDPGLEGRLASLRRGDRLHLLDEPSNSYNPRAVLTTNDDRRALGYVPDLLLDYVHTVRREGGPAVTVEHVNGPDAPAHLRLLARLEGHVPEGYRPFDGPAWAPVVRADG